MLGDADSNRSNGSDSRSGGEFYCDISSHLLSTYCIPGLWEMLDTNQSIIVPALKKPTGQKEDVDIYK